MPRQRSADIQERNQAIVSYLHEGHTTREAASKYGVSAARISQINQEWQGQVGDDATRDLLLSQEEGALTQLLPLIFGRGKRVTSAKGDVVFDEFGQPLYDEYAKTDAIRTMILLHERISRFRALDRKQRDQAQDAEFQQAMNYVNQLAERNRELSVKLSRYENPQQEIAEAEIVEDSPSNFPLRGCLISDEGDCPDDRDEHERDDKSDR